jgi:D-alanyl-D-alanine endopeptidase (penicillin-binding protein 7)
MKKILSLFLISLFSISYAYAEPVKKKAKVKKYKHQYVKTYKNKKVKYSLRSQHLYSPVSSYGVYDLSSNNFYDEHNVDDIKSIASITKLFTAITVINSKADLEEKLYVAGHNGGKVPRGTYISRIDLLKAMVTNSDNLAAEVLAHNHPGGFQKFLADANEYNKNIGLKNTSIVDSSGLLADNKSTAADLIKFLNHIKDNSTIKEIASLRGHEIETHRPKSKRLLKIKFHNTNPDIYKMDNVVISKTGFTNPAGRCVVMLIEKNSKLYALVVLGARNPQDRSRILHNLLDKSNSVQI